MRKSIAYSAVVVFLFAGLSISTALADDLGLQQMDVDKVGQTVKKSVKKAYKSAKDKSEVNSQIAAIMDEAAKTGNEQIIKDAIIAVMEAGGEDNLESCIAAINGSQANTDFPELVKSTVSSTKALITANKGGGKKDQGGGKKDQGGGTGGNPLDDGGSLNIRDKDIPGTPV